MDDFSLDGVPYNEQGDTTTGLLGTNPQDTSASWWKSLGDTVSSGLGVYNQIKNAFGKSPSSTTSKVPVNNNSTAAASALSGMSNQTLYIILGAVALIALLVLSRK